MLDRFTLGRPLALYMHGTETDYEPAVTAFVRQHGQVRIVTDVVQESTSMSRGRAVVAHNHRNAPGGQPLLVYGTPNDRVAVYDQSFSVHLGNPQLVLSAGVSAAITDRAVRVTYGALSFAVSPSLWSGLQARSSPDATGKHRSLTVYDVKALLRTDPVFAGQSASLENCAPVIVRFFGPALQVEHCFVNTLTEPGQTTLDHDPRPFGMTIKRSSLLGHIAFACAPSIFNAIAAVTTRISRVMTAPRFSDEDRVLVDEFIAAVKAETGVTAVDLWTGQQVYEAQDLPAQVRRNQLALTTLGAGSAKRRVQAFIKMESTTKASDPRNISNLDPTLAIPISQMTYPVKEAVLSRCHWYMPGKTPRAVGHEVVRFCTSLSHQGIHEACATDYSRYDGTISAALR